MRLCSRATTCSTLGRRCSRVSSDGCPMLIFLWLGCQSVDTRWMDSNLDVRMAIAKANEVFVRFPARLCVPMLVLGAIGYSAASWQRGHPLTIGLFGLLVTVLLNWFVGVVLSAMYLRARSGRDPSWRQANDVIRYRGLASTTAQLSLRYFMWILLLGMVAGVGTVLYSAFAHAGARVGPAAGVGSAVRGVGSGIRIILFLFFSWLVLYRYMFVFPMFVVERGAGNRFVDRCVARTKRVWRTGVLLMLAASVPTLLPSVIRLVVWVTSLIPVGLERWWT
jgi:hypothetical protein